MHVHIGYIGIGIGFPVFPASWMAGWLVILVYTFEIEMFFVRGDWCPLSFLLN